MASEVLNFLYQFALLVLIVVALVAAVALPAAALGYFAGRVDRPTGSRMKWWAIRAFLVGLVMVTAIFAYESIFRLGAGDTALLFVGLPALIAAGASIAVDFRSPMRTVFGAITLFLLIAVLWLGEGIICVIIAAPLFYLVAFVVMWVAREWYRRGKQVQVSIAVIMLVLFTSLEGLHAGLSFPREQTINVRGNVALPVAAVRENLARHPALDQLPLATVLRLGFPVPVEASGEGLALGDIRRFAFRRMDGVLEEVAFQVVESSDHRVVLDPVYDHTQIARWLGWRRTTIEWHPINATTTDVRVSMSWERRLDPAWYFAPVQRFVVGHAARVLIAHAGQSFE